MKRLFYEIVFTGVLLFLTRTILGVEIEEYWNGVVQPFLEANAWGWVAAMLSFVPTFWGGVVITIAVLLAVHQLTGSLLRWRGRPTARNKSVAASPLVQGVAPDGITFQLFPLHDGVDVAMIVTITNPTKAAAHVGIFGWDCEIGGRKPADRKGVGISSPILPGQRQRIRLSRVRIPKIGSDVSGWATMAIAFGDERSHLNTVAKFRYEFGFDDYGYLVPGETKISDYLDSSLTELEYQPADIFRKDEVTALR